MARKAKLMWDRRYYHRVMRMPRNPWIPGAWLLRVYAGETTRNLRPPVDPTEQGVELPGLMHVQSQWDGSE